MFCFNFFGSPNGVQESSVFLQTFGYIVQNAGKPERDKLQSRGGYQISENG